MLHTTIHIHSVSCCIQFSVTLVSCKNLFYGTPKPNLASIVIEQEGHNFHTTLPYLQLLFQTPALLYQD